MTCVPRIPSHAGCMSLAVILSFNLRLTRLSCTDVGQTVLGANPGSTPRYRRLHAASIGRNRSHRATWGTGSSNHASPPTAEPTNAAPYRLCAPLPLQRIASRAIHLHPGSSAARGVGVGGRFSPSERSASFFLACGRCMRAVACSCWSASWRCSPSMASQPIGCANSGFGQRHCCHGDFMGAITAALLVRDDAGLARHHDRQGVRRRGSLCADRLHLCLPVRAAAADPARAFHAAPMYAPNDQLDWSAMMYFSFTVLTSTGFGEITPFTRMARALIVSSSSWRHVCRLPRRSAGQSLRHPRASQFLTGTRCHGGFSVRA